MIRLFKRNKSKAEFDISEIQRNFESFQRLLECNNEALKLMNELEENVKAVEDGIVDLKLLVTNKDYTLDKLENAIHDLEAGKILGRATISIV